VRTPSDLVLHAKAELHRTSSALVLYKSCKYLGEVGAAAELVLLARRVDDGHIVPPPHQARRRVHHVQLHHLSFIGIRSVHGTCMPHQVISVEYQSV
jgi:hypothetical protein